MTHEERVDRMLEAQQSINKIIQDACDNWAGMDELTEIGIVTLRNILASNIAFCMDHPEQFPNMGKKDIFDFMLWRTIYQFHDLFTRTE